MNRHSTATWFRLFFFSLKLGVVHLVRGFFGGGRLCLREAVKRILIPMDISRYFELSVVVDEFRDGERVLDLSSPKLAAFYGARTHRGSFFVGLDRFQKEVLSWKALQDTADLPNLALSVADMVQLPFKDRSFDRVFSISVIEHLPDDLDSEALKEIARVLKPGGCFQMTTPLAAATSEVFLDRDIYSDPPKPGRTFFYRNYDPELYERKFKAPFAWKAESEVVCEDSGPPLLGYFERAAPWSFLAGPFLWIAAFFGLRLRPYERTSPPQRRADIYACFRKPA
jgi:SAM-dependent methyltransferase